MLIQDAFPNWNPQRTDHILDCDLGFDLDDIGALSSIIRNLGERFKAVITGLYRPEEKSRLAKAMIQQMRANDLLGNCPASHADALSKRVFSGCGYYLQDRPKEFFRLYPRWPANIFGDPNKPLDENYKCIYPHQTQAFEKAGVLQDIPLGNSSELHSFLEWLRHQEKPITLTATGPLTNIAWCLKNDPQLVKEKVKTIVMMNGTFANPPRMGYNGVLNTRDTETVLQSGIPCLIVSSEICKDFNLPLEKVKELQENKDQLTPFGQMMLEVMLNWEVHRARKKNPSVNPEEIKLSAPIFADPLTALLAMQPELIDQVKPVKYSFNHQADPEIHMLHQRASELVKVEDDKTSSVFEVVSLKSPEAVQRMFRDEILQLFPKKKLTTEIREVSEFFKTGGYPFCGPVKKRGAFFGVKKEQLLEIDFHSLKRSLQNEFSLPSDTQFLQIIGDSAEYSEEGTIFAHDFLHQNLEKNLDLILWGLTGHKNQECKDVNQLVNEWIDHDPSRAQRAIANIVDYHTPKAIEEWGCSVSTAAKHFLLVHGNAKFGDDVIFDALTDKSLCLEGGVQSFRQLVNFLSRGISIQGVYGLRGEHNPNTFDREAGQYIVYFSAIEFLNQLKINQVNSAKKAEAQLKIYLESHKLFNHNRPDAGTKNQLFKDAWKQFLNEELWNKLDCCEFIQGPCVVKHKL